MHLFLKGLELLCIIGQNLYKSDAGAKRACKKAEGLSSWMMDAMESATGTVYPQNSWEIIESIRLELELDLELLERGRSA